MKIYKLILLAVLFSHQVGHAESRAMTQTKNKLTQLQTKINQLQQHLSKAHDKDSLLKQELAHTEKKISDGALQLKKIQQDLQLKQNQLHVLQEQTNTLNEQLQAQQALLAKHVQARYKMSGHKPFQWLILQENPDTFNRLLTFYQYLVHSRQQALRDVKKTKETLDEHQRLHQQELQKLQQLKNQLATRQKAFDEDKQYHTALIQTLKKEISSKQQTLIEYQRNKNNLSQLLKTLSQQSVLQTRHPFSQMRKRLPKPVITNKNGFKKINQGIIFFADEGSAVNAIFPGKVVFSDWLNGYGLLLIVDHGWGFMTLYANNKTLLKHKGALVNQGEKIAFVGHTGTFKQNGLYFEVRQRGKAISPLEWMSKA